MIIRGVIPPEYQNGVIPPEYQNVTDTNVGKIKPQDAILMQEAFKRLYLAIHIQEACDMAIKAIRFQQSVVMCKDCTEYDIKLHACLLYDSIKSKNDYCSRGERRDEK